MKKVNHHFCDVEHETLENKSKKTHMSLFLTVSLHLKKNECTC